MKVLSLSSHDQIGGAAIAAKRLHLGLRKEGIDSRMLVADKSGDDPHTTAVHNRITYGLRRRLDRLPLILENTPGSIGWKSLAWLPNPKLTRAIRSESADLIHLHWAQNGFLPLRGLTKMNAPMVWTFHDLWPICGQFHHEHNGDLRNPERYSPANLPADRSGPDLDRWVWQTKERIYEKVHFEAVVPSQWMAEQVRASALWKDREIHVIPNGLDLAVFQPTDKAAARDHFKLPQNKTLILFGAMFADIDKNKGYRELRETLAQLTLPKESTELAVFGLSAPVPGEEPMPYETNWLGVLRDPSEIARLYSAADVMVVPSLQESFGQTASEPMACGTPVAAFNTTGLKDVVDHETNGFLAAPFDPSDLARGIEWILSDQDRYRALQHAARTKAEAAFDVRKVTQLHLDVYRLAIDRNPR